MLHIGGGFLTALDGYVQAVTAVAPDARDAGLETLTHDLQRRARMYPQWEPLAHHIESWEDENGIQVGIRKAAHVPAAQRAEYGDEKHGPVPLIRHMPGSTALAAERMGDVMRNG